MARTENYDLLIAGAGPVGCVIAERAATQKNWTSLIVEKRNHIAGNCYDRVHESGVLIHQYGPHYFRANDQKIIDYLSRYTAWIPGNYVVKSRVNGKLHPFPINLTTLELFFGRSFTEESAKTHLEGIRKKIFSPQNSEELVVSRVGRELYEAFYRGYTKKQWGKDPSELDPSVCGRIPVRLTRDERYIDDRFQLTPAEGFTRLFSKMIDHPQIQVKLSTDFREVQKIIKPKVATVYCGPLDEYFDHRLGKLPWRSIDFKFTAFNEEFKQPCVQINYPNEEAYTRSVEIKHVTGQKSPNTVLAYEFPKSEGDPYYPVPAAENRELFERYVELAEKERLENRVFFTGRLAQYRYMNTDEAIVEALRTFDLISQGIQPK